MVFFIIGLLCGFLLALSLRRFPQWLSIRVLPAQYLQTHTIRRRKSGFLKEAERSE